MRKEIIISEANDLAVVIEDGRAVEFFLRSGDQLVGDIIWGQVEAVVPGIEAAFVNIGQDRNGFIHVADLPSAQTPRRPTALKKPSIKVKERILVQIAKAPTGTKGARLTGRLTIPGRFLVLVPHDNRVSISRRITDTKERDRLRRLTLNLKDPGHGLIVRTEAIGRSEEDLRQDIEELIDIWADILHQVQIVTPPCLLHRDSDLIHRVLRDAMTADVTKVVVDTASGYQKARETLKGWMPELARYVIQHRGPQSILERYRIREELEAAISPKVWLPSGGYLVIEHTEALTVIDVNSGRLTQSKSLADTVLRTNIEAAAEVARQLRLRDIGGIVVIDFISMDSEGDKKKVQAAFSEALRQDKSRPQVTGFSEHGLIEVSRRRQGQNLLEQLTAACETCGGTGRIRTSPLLAGGDRARTEHEHTEPLEETAAIVHEITDAPYATEVALAEGEPAGEDEGEGEGEGEAGRRRRRRRRRRGRGGQEEGIGGMLTSTSPDGMTPEEEDEEGYLPPVMVPEQRREERPRREGRRERPAPAARAEAAPLFDEGGPLVEEVSFDWGAPAPQPRREERPRREELPRREERDRGRGRDRDREERPRRDERPAAQAPARTSAPAPAAPAGVYEVSAPARRTRRVERRPETAPVASTPAAVAPRAAAPAPAPVSRPVAAAPAPAPAAKPAPKPTPKPEPAAKRVEAPKRKVEPLPVPETVEEAAVPGLFVLKKKAPATAAKTEAPKAAEVEAPKKAVAKKAPAKKAEPAAEKPAAKKATTKKAAESAAVEEIAAKPAAKKTATKAPAKKADVVEVAAKPAAKKTAAKAPATKKAAATKAADEAEAKPVAKKPAAKKATTTKTTATKAKAGA